MTLTEVWINPIGIARLNGCCHVRPSVPVLWPLQDLPESTITIAVAPRTPHVPAIVFPESTRTIGTTTEEVTAGVVARAIVTILRISSKRSCVELAPETVRTSGILRLRHRRQSAKVATTTEKIVEGTIAIAEIVTGITAATTTRMILRQDAITSNGTGAIASRHRDPSIVEDRRTTMAAGIAAIITVRRSTVTDRTIRNRTRDLHAAGMMRRLAGRNRTAGSTTRIRAPTGSTRINASSSGITMTTREVTPITTVADDPEVAGKAQTKVPETGTAANPRKTWTSRGTNSPDGSGMSPIEAECSAVTPIKVPRCIITTARWTAAVATWTVEDAAVAASDPRTGTASTVPSRIWPTSRCSTSTSITIRRSNKWAAKVLQCHHAAPAACNPTHN